MGEHRTAKRAHIPWAELYETARLLGQLLLAVLVYLVVLGLGCGILLLAIYQIEEWLA